MRRILFLTTFIISCMFSHAQDSWKIKLNNKLILSADKEDEVVNTRKVKLSEWEKNGNLEIRYKETVPDTILWHSFLFFDEKDSQLLSKEKTLFAKIPLAELRELFAGKRKVRIYTIVSPRNPHFAVKIRRVHLCTLELP